LNSISETEGQAVTEEVLDQPDNNFKKEEEDVLEEDFPDTTPAQAFPIETWLVDSDFSPPVESQHPFIGPLLSLEPGEDEKDIYEQSSTILDQLPGQNPQRYFSSLRQALKVKISYLGLQGNFLLGAPDIKGPTAEVRFILQKEDGEASSPVTGTLYWTFDQDSWFLEDISIP